MYVSIPIAKNAGGDKRNILPACGRAALESGDHRQLPALISDVATGMQAKL